MSRFFNAGLTQYLIANGTPVPGPPFTFSAWGIKEGPHFAGGFDHVALSLGGKTSVFGIYQLGMERISKNIMQRSEEPPAFEEAQTSAQITPDVWEHMCGVEASTSDRRAYLNGANKGTDLSPITIIPTSTIGIAARVSPGGAGNFWGGWLGSIAIWNIALSDAEVLQLAQGTNPQDIQLANLVFFLDMKTPSLVDVIGGISMRTQGHVLFDPNTDPPVNDPTSQAPTAGPLIIAEGWELLQSQIHLDGAYSSFLLGDAAFSLPGRDSAVSLSPGVNPTVWDTLLVTPSRFWQVIFDMIYVSDDDWFVDILLAGNIQARVAIHSIDASTYNIQIISAGDLVSVLFDSQEFPKGQWDNIQILVEIGTIPNNGHYEVTRNNYFIFSDAPEPTNPNGTDADQIRFTISDQVPLKSKIDNIFVYQHPTLPPPFLERRVISGALPVEDAVFRDGTPSTGTDRFAMVNDPPGATAPDTTFNDLAFAGDKDSFRMTGMAHARDKIIHAEAVPRAQNNSLPDPRELILNRGDLPVVELGRMDTLTSGFTQKTVLLDFSPFEPGLSPASLQSENLGYEAS